MLDVVRSATFTVEELFNLGRFRPASVQRQFQWDGKQAEQLFSDIHNVCFSSLEDESNWNENTNYCLDVNFPKEGEADTDEDIEGVGLSPDVIQVSQEAEQSLEHFFVGTIILDSPLDNQYAIYDGLQRLTTLTVLLAILRDWTNDANLKARLNACIFDKGEPRLSHQGKSIYLRQRIQRPGQAGIRRYEKSRPIKQDENRLFEISRVLIDRLKPPRQEVDQEKIVTLSRYLLSSTLAVALRIVSKEMARHVFVATNLYGQPLLRSQVAKGELLDLLDDDKDLEFADAKWNTIRERVKDTFDDFLMAFDTIQRIHTFKSKKIGGRNYLIGPGPDPIGELVVHVGELIQSRDITLMSWLDTLETFAIAWADMMECLNEPKSGAAGNYLWRMSFFRWKDWHPLALHWWERYRALKHEQSNAYKHTIKRFAMLQQRCLMMQLYEFSPEDRRNILLKSLQYTTILRKRDKKYYYRDPFTKGGKTEGPPLNFSEKVYKAVQSNLLLPLENYETRRCIMLFYEAMLHTKALPSSIVRKGAVEHILPQKPKLGSHWLEVFDAEDERYLCLHSLGNLGLISPKTNGELGIEEFSVKRSAYKSELGSFFSISDVEEAVEDAQPYLMNEEPENDWTPTVVKRRTKKIAARIWEKLDIQV